MIPKLTDVVDYAQTRDGREINERESQTHLKFERGVGERARSSMAILVDNFQIPITTRQQHKTGMFTMCPKTQGSVCVCVVPIEPEETRRGKRSLSYIL